MWGVLEGVECTSVATFSVKDLYEYKETILFHFVVVGLNK